jgi:hypothetical protein
MTQTARGNNTAKGSRWRAVVFVGALDCVQGELKAPTP